jgi:hypothetical protein
MAAADDAGQGVHCAWIFLIFMVLSGCTAGKLNQSVNAFYAGQAEKAEALLSGSGPFSERDRLLYLMEKGTVLHHLGQYENSIKEFRKASLLMEKQEVISVVRQTSSLVTTEWITEYKGEYSERLWVHTYLMMDYLLLYKYEDALVEAKQALGIFQEHPETFKEAHFTRALIALCFDNLDELNGAFIEYKKLAASLPTPTPVAGDLYRLAAQLGFSDEAKKYRTYLTSAEQRVLSEKESMAELVLFIGLGRSPTKVPVNIILPPSIRFSFVKYERRSGEHLRVTVSGAEKQWPVSSISTDIGKVAGAALAERKRRIMAKETARVAAKEALAQAARNNSGDLAEILVRGVLFITEEPDTRSWRTLPARLTLLRIPLAPNRHEVVISVQRDGGQVIDTITLSGLNPVGGRRIYRSLRY